MEKEFENENKNNRVEKQARKFRTENKFPAGKIRVLPLDLLIAQEK
jgi:hypothetical protein